MTMTDRLAGINEGVAVKAPCVVATTANITLSGTQTIDGIAVVAGDRVLVKDQTTGSQNGIYVVSAGTWERAKDFNGSRDVVTGTKVYVINGTTNAQRDFILTTTSPAVGSSSLAWDYSSNATLVTANEASTTDTDTGTSSAKIMTPRRVKRALQTSTFYQRSGTSTVAASITTKLGYDFDLREWASSATLASDASTAWNNALTDINALGGGTLRMPPQDIYVGATIDNKYPRILCMGAGRDGYHDGGTYTRGTRIIPTFAGTVLKHRTPYNIASGKNYGGGFINMSVLGNGLATRLLEVDSVSFAHYDLYLEDCVGSEAALFKAGVSASDLAEPCDVQFCDIKIRGRQFGVGAPLSCTVVKFTGSVDAGPSFNNVHIYAQHYNGHAFDAISTDNNRLFITGINPGGSGKMVMARGPTVSNPVGCDSNIFEWLSGGSNPIYAEGTDTGGVTAGIHNIIRALDTGNATPTPTAGTGSSWTYQTLLKGTQTNTSYAGATVYANSDTDVATEKANVTTETARFRNNAGDCVRVTNGTQEWQVGVDGSGNLLIGRISGTGKVNLSNGAMAFVGSLGRQAPITKTADFSVADNENWYINNKTGSTCTVTLPAASSYTGREIMFTNWQAQTVVSASSNVVGITGGAASTAMLAGTAGKWCTVVSDGTNWIITAAN